MLKYIDNEIVELYKQTIAGDTVSLFFSTVILFTAPVAGLLFLIHFYVNCEENKEQQNNH